MPDLIPLLIDITGICAVTPPPHRDDPKTAQPDRPEPVEGPLMVYMPTSDDPPEDVEPHVPVLIVRGSHAGIHRIAGDVTFPGGAGSVHYFPLPSGDDPTTPRNPPQHHEHEAAFWIADMRDVWYDYSKIVKLDQVAATVSIPSGRVRSGLQIPGQGIAFPTSMFDPQHTWKARTITRRIRVDLMVPASELFITTNGSGITIPFDGSAFHIIIGNVEESDINELAAGKVPPNKHPSGQPDPDFLLYNRLFDAPSGEFPTSIETFVSQATGDVVITSLHNNCPPLLAQPPD